MGIFDYFDTGDSIDTNDTIKPYVDKAISTFESGNISQLQDDLYRIASMLNKPGSGHLITGYSQKDRLCEVFCMCLEYDWMNDSDIREVWAENAFYCISEYFNKSASTQQDYIAASLDLFLTCHYGKVALRTKFNDVLRRARIHPLHSSIFDANDYRYGAAYLIREFSFFSATLLSRAVRQYPQIIFSSLKNSYEQAKTDFEFAGVSPDRILGKMSFLSSIIGSILDDM